MIEIGMLLLSAVGIWVVARVGVKKLTVPLFAFLLAGLITMLGGFLVCSGIAIPSFFTPH